MSGPVSNQLRDRIRPVLVALAAGGVYGSWAALAHRHLGPGVTLHAGLTQAALSVTVTLALVLVLERLFRWARNPLLGFWLAFLGTSTLAMAWLVIGHWVAGTPHIAVAIAPSAVVGTATSFGYARMLLARARRGADAAAEG